MAAQHKHGGEVVDVLLDAGADVNAKSAGGVTPLHACAIHRHDEGVLALLKRGGNVDDENIKGMSALHWACVGGWPGTDRTVDLLLRWGASETALTTDGKIPSDFLEMSAEGVAGGGVPAGHTVREVEGEMQRALVLLARAPADRAWRRRCWLVMLRARAGREREARSSSSTSGSDRTEAAGRTLVGHDEGDGSNKVGKMDAGGSGSGSMDGERGGAGRAGRRTAAEEGSLRGLVPALLDVESEGVFRTIVCFL
ncbi:unnamed protein product [Ectocarpus fasciculatus]